MSIDSYLWTKTIIALVVGIPCVVLLVTLNIFECKRRRQEFKDICDQVRKRGKKWQVL